MKRTVTLLILVLITLVLGACNNEGQTTADTDTVQSIEQLVHEYSTGSFKDVSASITSTELIVKNSKDEQKVYELPEDKFFVSIAPYIQETHPCVNHSLTGCQGELVNEEFEVEIIDSEGNMVIHEKMETMANGFVDLWLPRNTDYQVKITHEDGKTAEAAISTYEEDQTCITTMQLKDSKEV